MNKKIIDKTSKDTGYTKEVVEFWCDKLWAFTRQVIIDGEFKGVMLPYFGKIVVRNDRKLYYQTAPSLSKSRKAAISDCYRLPKLGFLDSPGGGRRVAKIEEVPPVPSQSRPPNYKYPNKV